MRSRLALVALLALAGCNSPSPSPSPSPTATPTAAPAGPIVTHEPFGKTADGQAVDIYTLRNANGVELQGHHLRRHHHVAQDAGQERRARRHRPGLRFARRLSEGATRSSAPSSAATAIASRRAASRSMATSTSWRPTTARITFTAAARLRQAGVERRAAGGEERHRRFRAPVPTAKRAIPAPSPSRVTYELTDKNELIVEYQRHHRQGDAGEPDAAQLLQSGRATARATSSATC